MTLPHHDASNRDQRRCGKAKLFRTEQRGFRDVLTGAQLAYKTRDNRSI